MTFIEMLQLAFPEKWEEMLAVIKGTSTWREHPAAVARAAECYHPPGGIDLKLCVLNSIARTCGVEYLAAVPEDYRKANGVSYLNTGDTYAPTLCWDHDREKWIIFSWGDLVDSQPERFGDDRC